MKAQPAITVGRQQTLRGIGLQNNKSWLSVLQAMVAKYGNKSSVTVNAHIIY